jgi:hypothetical protein
MAVLQMGAFETQSKSLPQVAAVPEERGREYKRGVDNKREIIANKER